VSFSQDVETLAQWQIDSFAIDDENGSVRGLECHHLLECNGMESRVFSEYLKQITCSEAILVNDTDGKLLLFCCGPRFADRLVLLRRNL
jgi:hypothetical protein